MLCGICCKPKFYKPILCIDDWLIHQARKEHLEALLNGVIYDMTDEEIQKHKVFNIYLYIKLNGYIKSIESISEKNNILFITMSEKNTYIIIMNTHGRIIRVYITCPYDSDGFLDNSLEKNNYLCRIRALINSIHFQNYNIKLIIGFESIFFSLISKNKNNIPNNKYLPIFYSNLPLANTFSELDFLIDKYPDVPMLVLDKCFKIYNNISKNINCITGYKKTWCLTNTHIKYINPYNGSTEFSCPILLDWKTDDNALKMIASIIINYSKKH